MSKSNKVAVPAPTQTLNEMCDELVRLQRRRLFAIKRQSNANRSIEAFLARTLNYNNEAEEADRKAVFKAAAALRESVEATIRDKTADALLKGAKSQNIAEQAATQYAEENVHPDAALVRISAVSRSAWDTVRDASEKQMRDIAKNLPGYSLVKNTSGLAELGFAIITAEVNAQGSAFSDYSNPWKVYKRLGLAVINGEGQRRKADVEQAALHGFSPRRRAEIWAVVDSMFRHQWAGDKDAQGKNPKLSKQPVAVPAHATGPYGEVYAKFREHYASKTDATGKAWSDAHKHNAARRAMTKALVLDLWKAWNRATAANSVYDADDAALAEAAD